MIFVLLTRFFLLCLCLAISAIFLELFNVSVGVGDKTLIPESASLMQTIIVITLSGLIPFLLLCLVFWRDMKLLVLSSVLLVFYFFCLRFNLTIGPFQSNQADLIEVHFATALMLLLFMLNFIHLIYPLNRIKPLLKLLPIFSFIWMYVDSIYPALSMLIGKFLFEFYGFEEVMGFIKMAIFIFPNVILFAVIPLFVFVIARYVENIGEFLNMLFRVRK